MTRQALWSGVGKADAQCCVTSAAWTMPPGDYTMVHEISYGLYPSPLGDFTVGRVPMDVARGVFGVALIFGAVVILLTLLNRRDRRASRLRQAVLDQLALPELRGRVGVHIQCAVFSRRRAVVVDLLAGMPQEVWNVLHTHGLSTAAARPPRGLQHARFQVHAAIRSRDHHRTLALSRAPHVARRPLRWLRSIEDDGSRAARMFARTRRENGRVYGVLGAAFRQG